MYAFQKFILLKMQEKQISKVEFVKRIGYHNIAKGLRRFDDFIQENNFNKMIMDNLHIALDEPIEIIDQKFNEIKSEIKKDIEEAKSRQEEIERKNFVPFLYCHTANRIPSPIFVCAMLGLTRFKKLNLPLDYNSQSFKEQEVLRKQLITELMKEFDGIIPSFDRIICFTLKRNYDDIEDEREVYDLNGNLISSPPDEHKKISIGSASIFIKGKEITNLFQNLEWERTGRSK